MGELLRSAGLDPAYLWNGQSESFGLVGVLSCFDDVDDVQVNVGAKVLIDFHQLIFSVIIRLAL